ncbi:MAG: methyltransferase domain-containing protein [Halofilum sp. (in: g-proteobacteria)]
MPVLRDRRRQPEWMDDPALAPEAHRHALAGLARLNRIADSAGALWRALRPTLEARIRRQPVRVLDLACGGGDVTLGLWQRARRAKVPLALTAWDASELALTVARERAERLGAEIDWQCRDLLADPWPGEFDVVVSSLFLHHLEPTEAIAVLRRSASADTVRILDLARSRGGWCLARAGSALCTRSPVVRCDGPRSVEGAFTVTEAEALAGAAGLVDARVGRCWPARWMLHWDRPH